MIGRRTFLSRLAGTGALAATPFPALRPRRAAAAEPLLLWTSEHETSRLHVMDYLARAYSSWAGAPAPRIESIPEERFVGAVGAARQAGRLPDLVNTGGDLLLALDDADHLDRETAAAVIAETGDFFEGAVLALTAPSGGPVAIPFHGWPQILWYREDLFTDNRLPPPGSVRSLLAAAEALHDPASGRIGVVCGTDDSLYTQQVFTHLARAEGAELLAADGTPTLDRPAVRQALASYAAMAAHGPPGAVNWRARDWYIQGRAAMMFYSTFIMDDLAIPGVAHDSLLGGRFPGLDGAPFDEDLVRKTRPVAALAPGEAPARATFSMINGLAAFRHRDAARRAAAVDFLRFLFRPDSYVVWLHMAPGGMLPVRRNVAETDAFLRDPIGVFRRFGRGQIRQLADSLVTPGSFSHWHGVTVPNAATVYADGLVGRMVARVVSGAMGPAESASAAQAEAETLLRRR